MRQVLSTALVAVIVGALAGVTAGTMAQAPAESERVITQTGFNADKVDNEGVTRIRGHASRRYCGDHASGTG